MSTEAEGDMSVTVGAHLGAETVLRSRVYVAENRVTVALEGTRITAVTLFADRADVERLRVVLGEVLTELDAAPVEVHQDRADSAHPPA